MVSKLQKELKQNKPFRSVEEETILNIVRAAEHLTSEISSVLKTANLTVAQYNALKILRGAGSEGLSCGEISERMVTKESDITRLLDRIEARGFISRKRPANNRRIVVARITDEGQGVLAELDETIDESNRNLVGHLGVKKLTNLKDLLEAVRNKD